MSNFNYIDGLKAQMGSTREKTKQGGKLEDPKIEISGGEEKKPRLFSEFIVEKAGKSLPEEEPRSEEPQEDFEEEIEEYDPEGWVSAEEVFQDVLERDKEEKKPSTPPRQEVETRTVKPAKLKKKGAPAEAAPKKRGIESILGAKLDEEPLPEGEWEEPEPYEEERATVTSITGLHEGLQEVCFKFGVYEVTGFLKLTKKYKE